MAGFKKEKLVPLYRLNIYADDKGALNDLDLAKDVSDLIEEMILRRIRPILDFEGIYKIEPYWLVLALIKWVLKCKEETNKIIGIANVSDKQLKLINIIADKILSNGKNILDGITVPKLPSDADEL